MELIEFFVGVVLLFMEIFEVMVVGWGVIIIFENVEFLIVQVVEVLNVLCLFLIKLFEDGVILYWKVGKYCCVCMEDVMFYKVVIDIECEVVFD